MFSRIAPVALAVALVLLLPAGVDTATRKKSRFKVIERTYDSERISSPCPASTFLHATPTRSTSADHATPVSLTSTSISTACLTACPNNSTSSWWRQTVARPLS